MRKTTCSIKTGSFTYSPVYQEMTKP